MTEIGPGENVLAQEFSIPALLKFTFPTVLMMVFMGLYTITDTIFVSRLAGTDALAAMNIVCPAVNLMVGIGTMLAAGGNALISRKMGEGKVREVREDFTLLILGGVIVGSVLTAAGQVWMEPIIRGLGASERLAGYCRDYLTILLLFFPAGMLQTLFANLFVTAGKPGFGAALSVGAGTANIFLDYFFMKICGWGICGAAFGTGIGYLIPAGVGVAFFLRDGHTLRFCRPKWKPGVLVESCRNGSSEMVSQMASAVTTFLFNAVMLRLKGEDGVAAVTIMIYVQFLLSTLYIGFSMGTAPIIGFVYGSKDGSKLRRLLRRCFKIVVGSSLLVFVLSAAGGQWLSGVFSPAGTSVHEMTAEGFSVFCISFLFCGANIFISAMFTALSDGRTSAVLSFTRTFGFPTSGILLLPALFGVTGVWMAVPAAEGLAFVIGAFMYAKNPDIPLETHGRRS